MDSRNFSYAYNEEYFTGYGSGSQIDWGQRNHAICGDQFDFSQATPVQELTDQQVGKLQHREIVLYSTYPGILMGTGYLHDVSEEEAIKNGFSLDYVTGMPYLPGSSLKGILRSVFPGRYKENVSNSSASGSTLAKELEAYLRDIAHDPDLDVYQLEEEIFDNGDVFVGAYPDLRDDKNKSLFEMDYITPHDKGRFKEPVPISIMRVRPGVAFRFAFLLRDPDESSTSGSEVSGTGYTADKKLEMFRQILLDMGIGAKTNVGYGKLSESLPGIDDSSAAIHDNTIQKAIMEKTETVTVEEIHVGFPNGYVIAKRGSKRYRCNDVAYEQLGELREGKSKLLIKFDANGETQDNMTIASLEKVVKK